MSYFPLLEAKPLPQLIGLFSDVSSVQVVADEAGLFLQELTIAIAKCGKDGVAFLLDSLSRDGKRQREIVAALAFADRGSITELLPRIETMVASLLSSPEPGLVVAAVDCADGLAFVDLADAIRGLLNHESPYVVGSVLRFLSAHFPSDAKPQLFKALKSPEPIVRQNAVDELDELECKEALPCIAGLLDDPDKDVRDAAHWAVEHLESV